MRPAHDCIKMSRSMTKPTKWPMLQVNTQISLGDWPVWSESSLHILKVAKDPRFLHGDSKDWSDRPVVQLVWVFAGCTGHFVGFVLTWLKCQRRLTPTSFQQLIQQTGPLLSKLISSSETAITADTHQVGDVVVHKILGRLQSTFSRTKLLTSCTSNHCTTLNYRKNPKNSDTPKIAVITLKLE